MSATDERARWIHPKVAAWREGRDDSASRGGPGHDLLTPEGVDRVDLVSLEAALRASLKGEVLFDAGHRAIYSHDSSNYRQAPLGVVVPESPDDIVAAVAACRDHGAPVLPRGCGTSLSGETCNVAVVIDASKHLREVLEVNADEGYAWVEPGVIRDQLAHPCEAEHGLTFAPDTSTHAYATFGGMLGNNSCGIHSVMAGRTSDNTHALDVVTYDGLRMRVGATSEKELDRIIADGGRRGEIYRRMRDLRDRYGDLIRREFPDIPRRVSGYNLDELLPERGFNVARALVGSEGTLATILGAKVRLVRSPPCRSLLVLGYPDVYRAADHVPEILELGPIGLEGIDRGVIEAMQALGVHARQIALLPEGDGFLLVEFGADAQDQCHDRALECMEELKKASNAPAMLLLDDPSRAAQLWETREGGLGATAYHPTRRDRWPGWEDAAVQPMRLGDYLRDFRRLLEKYGYDAALYGHFGDGCIHCRISFDLTSAEGLRDWRSFLDEAADLVVGEYGGSLSGEHGDGQQRAELLPKMYGPELLEAMRELKRIWDPDNRMNPHKVVDPYPIVSNLKLGSGYDPLEPETYFAYEEDGGSFAHAALRCVGAGKCRDTDRGTMCPSYMATLDEQHSTRGRSRILYEMLRGDTIAEGFRSDQVHEALDLCLSCKGCKRECPVSVDMATYKAEFLKKHFQRRLRPPEAYSMGLIMFHARVAQHVPRLANALTRAAGISWLVKRLSGISPQRRMPSFAHETFRAWFDRRGAVNAGAEPVLLLPDTFNNFLHPEVLKAATEVLEASGRQVLVPEQSLCCGRPLYDHGMLDLARVFWKRMLRVLRPYVREGTPMVGAEPSCVASFRDELPNMLPGDEDARRLTHRTLTLAEFLERHAADWEPPKLDRGAVVHGHCHQEAVMGMAAEQSLYARMGLDYEVLDSGCCGMAGSFGFVDGHYDVSVKIGEQRLLPMVRETPEETIVIADGFSCKTQVDELTHRRPLHTAQVMKMAMDHGPSGVAGGPPERAYPDLMR